MDPYISDWLNLILRFVHLVTGIAWIGASFYFIWLDNHLQDPPKWKSDKGIKGELWAIHGGGFYEIGKYKLAPSSLPETLHWFKWEAYSTWISGFFLLFLMYYLGAETYLIDPRVANLTQVQAVSIGMSVIFGSWLIYGALCKSKLAQNALLLGTILLLLIGSLAFALGHIFSARGAYIHVGAVIGTIMAGNVFSVIIPSQKALVAAVEKGQEPDPAWGIKAKLCSTHNTYLTLPVVFIMISNHYPMTYNHEHAWLVLVAIIVITAAIRQYFVLRHSANNKPLILTVAAFATMLLAFLIAPERIKTTASVQTKSNEQEEASMVNDELSVEGIIKVRCTTCHSNSPTDDVFKIAPSGVELDTLIDIKRWSSRIKARTVDSLDMPLMNKTQMTLEERQFLSEWISQDE